MTQIILDKIELDIRLACGANSKHTACICIYSWFGLTDYTRNCNILLHGIRIRPYLYIPRGVTCFVVFVFLWNLARFQFAAVVIDATLFSQG